MKGTTGLSRRDLLRSAGAAVSAASLPAGARAAAAAGPVKIEVDRDGVVRAETATLRARVEKGFLTRLTNKASGEEYIEPFDLGEFDALQLVYPRGEAVDVGERRFGEITARQVAEDRAELIFHNWNGDGVIAIRADAATGDLLFEPSAYSSRPGVRACRWNLRGVGGGLKLAAPFFQGVLLELEDPLIRGTHWDWPRGGEAALAIFQARSGGFWVHTEDTHYRYKALQVGIGDDARALGFETEAYGPIDANLAAGGLAWRVNVFQGDWRRPAARYREWLWEAYGLRREEERRKAWIHELAMAISWCPGEIAILEALAERVDPHKVLIHFPNWRTDPYDENYPTYVPSDAAIEFVARANEMGFHVMPHFNSLETDPTNPVYEQVRDFAYRDIETKKLHGWSWVNRRPIGVPESNLMRGRHRDKKVMVKIHPGLAMWRSILCGRIAAAVKRLGVEQVFIDVTLNTYNLHNCLVEGMTPSEGIDRLIHQVAEGAGGAAVGGEGLNEVTFRGLSFGQVHLFKSWHRSVEGLERTGGCPLNNFLFGKLCRAFGYSGLGGKNADEELRSRIHEEHEALPTITIRSAAEIVNPTPAVKRALARARG